jgi:hydrogenase-4 component F
MGILCIGASLGKMGIWAALFHVWNNGMTKGAMFLSSGNIRRAAGARSSDEVGGMAAITPYSAAIFLAGMLAVTACPPFGPFFSELKIVQTAFAEGYGVAAFFFLAFLLLAFLGLSRLVFAIVFGKPRTNRAKGGKHYHETAGVILPALVLLGLSLWLGVATPRVLQDSWTDAVNQIVPSP